MHEIGEWVARMAVTYRTGTVVLCLIGLVLTIWAERKLDRRLATAPAARPDDSP